MSDVLDLDGVTLTWDQCDELLAFWDREGLTGDQALRLPDVLWSGGQRIVIIDRAADNGPVDLTPERVKRIRDWAYPWTEMQASLATYKRLTRYRGREGILAGYPSLVIAPTTGGSDLVRVPSDATVLQRRPHKPTLTLRDVEHGQRFRFVGSGGYIHRRTGQGWVEEATWNHVTADDLHLQLPVTRVEDES